MQFSHPSDPYYEYADEHDDITEDTAWEKAEEIQATLTDKDFPWNKTIVVNGNFFKGEFDDAFALRYWSWYLVFSRHQRKPHVFRDYELSIKEIGTTTDWAHFMTVKKFEERSEKRRKYYAKKGKKK